MLPGAQYICLGAGNGNQRDHSARLLRLRPKLSEMMDAQRNVSDPAHSLGSLDPGAQSTARKVREAILEHLHRSGGGHFGGCSSCVEILLALCASRPLACREGTGDRLLLSKGHASMALYAVLSLTGPETLPLAKFG